MKLGNKIRLTVGGAVGVLTLSLVLYMPARQEKDLVTSFNREVQSLGETVALGVNIGLKSGDISAAQSAMEYAKKDPRVRFVVLTSGGATIAAHPSGFVFDETKLDADTVVVTRAPVQSEALTGEIIIGASPSQIRDLIQEVRLTALLIGCGALAGGLFVAFWLAKQVVRPVTMLRDVAVRVGEGELAHTLKIDSNDELGELGAAFNKMVENVSRIVKDVRDVSNNVAQASAGISSSTEQMAAGTQEQSSQASEVASAVEEMTRTIIENAKNANRTAETAKRARQVAEEGGKVVDETITGMRSIADVVNKSAETVRALGKSSDEIGEIIGVIDEIADQTNLLALNAAIEAARAGEHGRGFAVVADEVRKLAERTTKATKEIASMIKAIQSDTTGAVSSMEEGTRKVSGGINLADKAGTSLREIVEVSQQVMDMVAQIAAASEEQSSASEQISKNVEAISTVTNETGAGTQQIARSAEDLNQLTQHLLNLVAEFKLAADMAGSTGSTPHHGSMASRSGPDTKSRLAVRQNGALVHHD